MKFKLMIIVLSLSLGGCLLNPGLFKPKPIKGVCLSEGNVFDLGRIAFTAQLDENWEFRHFIKDEDVVFHFDSFNPAIMVAVASYNGSNHDVDFDSLENIKENEEARDVPKMYGRRFHRPEFEVEILKIGNLECVRSFDLWHAPVPAPQYQTPLSGGIEESVVYQCPVPSQKGLLPINVSVSQSVGREGYRFDMDEIAQNTIKTIEINPNPPPNTKAIPSRMFESWIIEKDEFIDDCHAGTILQQDPDYICPEK